MPQAPTRSKPHGLTAPALVVKLKQLGKPGTAEIYRRHGAAGEVWGVSFADLTRLTKQIKVDHALACELWDGGVVDARTLALMVADPAAVARRTVDQWLREANAPVLVQYLAQLVARTAYAAEKMEAWVKAADDLTRAGGYTLLAVLARDHLSDAECRRHLAAIEKSIHASPNRARYAMNAAVIAIGVGRPALGKDSVATARRIGKVEVDHGETGCKTPDAETYILKALARKKG